MNNYMIERNERRTRTFATIFAIGLHLGLGALLYFQMADKESSSLEKPVKVNLNKSATKPQTKAASIGT
ncbi:MAG: hypothetical protein H6576_17510 [Lewinellaceae bacterium]|nr:hypothetical protein [Lewinellaceae bacterium]